MSEKGTLTKLLTICMECKKIKLGENNWISEKVSPEIYQRAYNQFKDNLSHGCCPSCAKKLEEKYLINS